MYSETVKRVGFGYEIQDVKNFRLGGFGDEVENGNM